MWLHAWTCTLSRLDHDVRSGQSGPKFERDKAAAMYFFDMAASEIRRCLHDLLDNTDDSMRSAAHAALTYSDSLPNDQFTISEASPNAKQTGRAPPQVAIKQFPGDSASRKSGEAAAMARPSDWRTEEVARAPRP
jgi:hypothetical protein